MAKREKAATPLVVEQVSIGDLAADPTNVRVRDERARGTLEASLRRFGPARSIVLDGSGVVRAGSGTLEAAARAGVTEVLIVDPQPGQLVAVRRRDWTLSEATAYAIADNRTAELAVWDDTALATTLDTLNNEGFDLANVGYTEGEFQTLIARIGDGLLGGGESDGGLPAEANGKEYDEGVVHSVRAVLFTEEQWPVILRAVEKIRESEEDPTIKEGRCLELIVADFLAGA